MALTWYTDLMIITKSITVKGGIMLEFIASLLDRLYYIIMELAGRSINK